MIDLKRNSKKQLVPATGTRSRSSSIYEPNQTSDFKISRGKFSDFLTCKRCFYLDRVIGLEVPGTPGWSLNETTDLLLKKEFDECREKQVPHRLFGRNGLDKFVPFLHDDIDKWRDSLHHGLIHRFKDSNIILTGGVDDIWQDLDSKKLAVVDYKSQAKKGLVTKDDYLEDPYHASYKIQMDFYAYLLINMGFSVNENAYFLVCNARREKKSFSKIMLFDEYIIPYQWNVDWLEYEIENMVKIMNNNVIPDPNISCKNCAYSDKYSSLFK